MKTDSIANNQYPLGKESIPWFGEFIHLQDEVPVGHTGSERGHKFS